MRATGEATGRLRFSWAEQMRPSGTTPRPPHPAPPIVRPDRAAPLPRPPACLGPRGLAPHARPHTNPAFAAAPMRRAAALASRLRAAGAAAAAGPQTRTMSAAAAAAAAAAAGRRLAIGVPALGLGGWAAVADEPQRVVYSAAMVPVRRQRGGGCLRQHCCMQPLVACAAACEAPPPTLPPAHPQHQVRLGRDVACAVSMLADYSWSLRGLEEGSAERAAAMKACHQRGADRLLDVCFKNGGASVGRGNGALWACPAGPTEPAGGRAAAAGGALAPPPGSRPPCPCPSRCCPCRHRCPHPLQASTSSLGSTWACWCGLRSPQTATGQQRSCTAA